MPANYTRNKCPRRAVRARAHTVASVLETEREHRKGINERETNGGYLFLFFCRRMIVTSRRIFIRQLRIRPYVESFPVCRVFLARRPLEHERGFVSDSSPPRFRGGSSIIRRNVNSPRHVAVAGTQAQPPHRRFGGSEHRLDTWKSIGREIRRNHKVHTCMS